VTKDSRSAIGRLDKAESLVVFPGNYGAVESHACLESVVIFLLSYIVSAVNVLCFNVFMLMAIVPRNSVIPRTRNTRIRVVVCD
jgi:hypothetical protein